VRAFGAALVALTLLATGSTASAVASPSAAASAPRLTNLAHLDFLTDTVTPPTQDGHTTYRLDSEPSVGVLWVYADHQSDGSFRRTGGGSYDAASNTYGQGAYDADDVSRAAVVYLRHWVAFHDQHSRDEAYQLLRGLTYLQTVTGPHAGDVVLWMQPDGTLHPSAVPIEQPDPSDSGPSFWLARSIWALGEGYAALRDADPSFAAFLRQRLELAVTALDRDVLSRYGRYQLVDGLQMPSWLIVDGADASSEAVLGLAAALRSGVSTVRPALAELSAGIAAMGFGDAQTWPYGAILPSATSRSLWHAWGAQMPTALVRASTALGNPKLLRAAVADAAGFTPYLLTATGPDNGLLPTPIDGSQIAYGADSRVQALLAVGSATHAPGLRFAAGIAAGWFFGQNPAGVATYSPASGITNDGVSPDGVVNLNSGAESTIHGLLTMEALDDAPDVAEVARASARIEVRDGQRTVEAEAAQLLGAASVVAANPAWTGESQWSGGAYALAGPGSTLSWALTASAGPRLVSAVINRMSGPGAVGQFSTSAQALGTVHYGDGGGQGVSPAPGALLPVSLPVPIDGRAQTLQVRTLATDRPGSGQVGPGQLDALLVTPLISLLVLTGNGHAVALLSSQARAERDRTVVMPGNGAVSIRSYDATGQLRQSRSGDRSSVTVPVPAGGFAIVWR